MASMPTSRNAPALHVTQPGLIQVDDHLGQSALAKEFPHLLKAPGIRAVNREMAVLHQHPLGGKRRVDCNRQVGQSGALVELVRKISLRIFVECIDRSNPIRPFV
jgi:hypothetical protein